MMYSDPKLQGVASEKRMARTRISPPPLVRSSYYEDGPAGAAGTRGLCSLTLLDSTLFGGSACMDARPSGERS